MHPGAWFVWAGGAGAVVLVTTNPLYLLVVVAAAWVVHAAHRNPGPAGRAFRSFAVFALITLFTRTVLVLVTPGPTTSAMVAYAAVEGMRLAALLIVFGTLSSVTDPFGVVKLAPRRWHEPALAASLALSLAPRTMLAAARVREAQRMRGIVVAGWRSLPALAVPVLQMGMEEALVLAESMDARGHGNRARSKFGMQSWNGPSLLTAAAGALAATAFLWLRATGDPTLTSSQILPVATVAPPAALAAFLLAIPAAFPTSFAPGTS